MSRKLDRVVSQPQGIALRRKPRLCPDCQEEITRAKRMYLTKYDAKVRTCPRCGFAIHYKKCRGETVIVPYDDYLTALLILERLNNHLTEKSGDLFDFGEATGREVALAYKMIDWGRRFMDKAQFDLGMTIHDFLLGLMDYILADEWWGEHMTSLVHIQNRKQRLAWEFYESEARKRGVETPKQVKTKSRLRDLVASFNNKGESDDSNESSDFRYRNNPGYATPEPF